MAHELSLPCDLHTACDLVATVVNILESRSDDIHMVVCIDTSCDAETEKVETTETVLACYRIAVSEDVTDLASAYTCLNVEFDRKSLCWKLLLRDLVKTRSASTKMA